MYAQLHLHLLIEKEYKGNPVIFLIYTGENLYNPKIRSV